MNSSQLPDVLVPVNKTTMSNVDIYTSVLEPVNKSQRRVIFNIKQQSILNPGSRINISVHPDDATASAAGDCFLPTTCGVAACIETAILRVGTRELARTEKFGEYYGMKRSVHTASQKTNIDMPLDGAVSVVSCSPNVDGKYAIDTGCAVYTNKTTAEVPAKYKCEKSTTNSSIFSIGLNDLFPMMRGMMLPLFALKEQVSVELILKQQAAGQTGKTILFANAPGSTKTSYALDNISMLIDYLEYDQATMNAIREQVNGDGLPMYYPDISVTSTQLIAPTRPAAGAVTKVSETREVGSAGLQVNNVMVVEKNVGANPLTGDYRSSAMVHPPAFNWRVNDKIMYPRRLTNTSYMRSEMEDILGFPMSVPSVQYSYDVYNNFYENNDGGQNVVMDGAVNLMGQPQTHLAGNYFITGLNLRKGPGGAPTDVVNKNILYERETTYSRNDYANRTIDFFVEHQRSFVIQNGVVMTSA